MYGSYPDELVYRLYVPLELNTHTSGQPAFPQGTNDTTLLGSMPPPPFEPLLAQQIATSTNKTCTLTPSQIEIEGVRGNIPTLLP